MLFIQTDKWEEKLSVLVLYSALISIVIGFIQYYLRVLQSPALFLPDGRPIVYAVDGIMSHKNLFSLSLLMMLPFIAYGIYSAKKELRPVFIAAFILIFILIILLRTRAVWLGMLVSGTIMMTILILLADKFHIPGKWRNTLIAGILVILFASIVLFNSSRQSSQNSFIRYLNSMADTKNVLNTGRLKTWSLTISMIREHYLTGVGAGNWQINAPAYYKGRFSDEEQLNWIRPHNDYLWVMSEKGITGIILFLSIFGLVIYYLLVIIDKSTIKDKVLSLFLLAGIVVYLVASAFDFPYERPYHQAFLALYLISAVTMMHRLKPNVSVNIKRLPVMIPYLLLISFAVYYSFSVVSQEVYLRKAYTAFEQHDGPLMLANAREAESPLKNMDPLANPVASYLGKAYSELHDFPNALIAFQEAYRVFPDKMKSIINLAEAYGKLNMYKEAENVLKKGLKLYPDHPVLQKTHCDLYFAQGDFVRAYVILLSIHGWENDSSLSRNVRFLENKLEIGDEGNRELLAEKISQNELVLAYTLGILTNPEWIEMVRKKAGTQGKTVQEMIRIDAEYMVNTRFNYYKSMLENDTVAIALLINKAMSYKKSSREMIKTMAEIMVEREILNGK